MPMSVGGMFYVFRAMSGIRRPYFSFPFCISQMKILDWYLRGIRMMYYGTKVCRVVEPWCCDFGRVTFDPEIPFHSVSPEQMQILDWYVQG
jgi:hypothetical protein